MAGNAFNGFVLLAVLVATFSCYDWELGLNPHPGLGSESGAEVVDVVEESDNLEECGESEYRDGSDDDLFGSGMSSVSREQGS